MSLVTVDPSSEVSVTTLLENARTWIAQAVETSSPMEIAFAKAQIATAAEATKQLGLSREIQEDAVEMVRRAEYALGKAIRKGQQEGTVAQAGNPNFVPGTELASPTDFASDVELYDRPSQRKVGILSIADSATPEEFDQALVEAKAEGNLSRANIGRKVNPPDPTGPSASGVGTIRSPALRQQRADLIADLAAQGYSVRQMPVKTGVSEETVRQIIRDYDIDVPAERSVGRTRRHDSARIASETVIALEGLVMGVELIDYDAIDPAQAGQWVDSLDHSLRVLNRFRKQIKETTQ